jgi:WD40 repeat protein
VSRDRIDNHDLGSEDVVDRGTFMRGAQTRVRILTRGCTVCLALLAIGLYYQATTPSNAPALRAVVAGLDGPIHVLAFRPGGGLVMATKGSGIRLIDLDRDNGDHGERRVPFLEGFCAALAPDASVLAVGGNSAVTLWDVASDASRIKILTRTGKTRALAFSHDSAMVAVAGERSMSLLDAASGHELVGAVPDLRGVTSLAFSPDGRALAMGDLQGYLRIWDLAKRRQRAAVRAHLRPVTSLAFSRDGAALVSASFMDSVARIWDPTTCRLTASLRGHPASVQTAAFSPDGRTLATVGTEGSIRLWDPETGWLRAIFQGSENNACAIAFSPDGRTLVAGGVGEAIWTWDVPR